MLVHQHVISRKRKSIVISAKLGADIPDLVQNLKLDNEKEKMMTECSIENIQKYLLLNHNIIEILKYLTEILEFNVEEGANEMKPDGLAEKNNNVSIK